MTRVPGAFERLLWKALMHVRPAELADRLKRGLCIPRLVIEAKNGCRYLADPVSILGQHLLEEGAQEPEMTALLAHVLRQGDLFVDVGGNEGYFTVQAASRHGGKVLCVEPQGRLQGIIRKNLDLNACTASVEVLHLALGESDGTVRLNLRPSTNTGASGTHLRSRFSSDFEDVPCTSLDALLEARGNPRVRLTKVDCEGAEREVFAGASRSISRGAFDFIALEYHPAAIGQAECDRIHARLTAGGYIQTSLAGQPVYERDGTADREAE